MYNDLFVETNLPALFDEKELYEHFKRMQDGDENAREEIINHSIRLVINEVLNNFFNTSYEEKDLVCTGLIGLIRSVDTFDINRCSRESIYPKFVVYSRKCIDNEILMFMRKGKRHFNNDSFDRTIIVDKNGNELKFEDVLYDEKVDLVSDYEKRENYEMVREVVCFLPEREKRVIMLYFGFIDDQPKTQCEIADLLGINQGSVSRIIKRALKTISSNIKKQEMVSIYSKKQKNNN